MISITINYSEKWQIKGMSEYKFAKKKLFNTKTGKEIKKCLKGYTIGYNLRGKFYSMSSIKLMVERVKKTDCPF
jgi:hypothetical protein